MNTYSPKQASKKFPLLLALACATAGTGVIADDIDVYLLPPQKPVYHNLLFLLDESGSMAGSKIADLKDAMKNLIDSPIMSDFHIAIIGYSTYGYYHTPKYGQEINVYSDFTLVNDTTKDSLKSIIDDLTAGGGTPTIPTFKAAIDWYSSSYTEDTGKTFSSPLLDVTSSDFNDYRTWHCTENHVVLLTDGIPNMNNPYSWNGINAIEEYPTGTECDESAPSAGPYASGGGYQAYGGKCGGEIASWALDHDFVPDSTGTPIDASDGLQNVVTDTIGFGVGDVERAFLEHVASHGGGNYYAADDATDLLDAFTMIAEGVKKTVEYTYTAPTIPFNADNAAVSGKYLYLPLFEPDSKYFWKGNLKKYQILYTTSGIEIKDSGGADAIEEKTIDGKTTIVLADSTDYWNGAGSSDSGKPLIGGSASKMSVDSGTKRNLYTYLGTSSGDLIADANRVHPDNFGSGPGKITKELLDVSDDTEAQALLNWIAWTDTDDSHEGEMGAPLHTKAQVVGNYVLISTVEGILHAFDKDTGVETWAYMPSELLKTIKDAKENGSLIDTATGSFDSPLYGLDGPMTIYETSDGNRYVVVGQRRGGTAYYALKINDPSNPQFAWKIIGGTGDFSRLGQTWSKPIFTKLEIGGGDAEDVLVFGGGYDPSEDDKTSRSPDDTGNAVFIVKASDGSKIKEISNSDSDLNIDEMENSIPSDLLMVDINANGITDRIYATDVGGRIIRIDIPDKAMGGMTPSGDEMSGGVIADINAGETDYRRFFNTPEVAYFKRGGSQFLTLMVTSGNRADPTGRTVTNERFYAIKDPAVWQAPSEYEYVTEADSSKRPIETKDLFNADVNLDSDTSNDVGNIYAVDMDLSASGLQAPRGWYINLPEGEKGFSAAKVYDYAVIFTTYWGEKEISTDSCVPSKTNSDSFFYALNMLNGKARFSDVTGIDGKMKLKIPGLPPSPQLLFPKTEVHDPDDPDKTYVRLGGTVMAIVGLEKIAQWKDRFHPISWEEVIDE